MPKGNISKKATKTEKWKKCITPHYQPFNAVCTVHCPLEVRRQCREQTTERNKKTNRRICYEK